MSPGPGRVHPRRTKHGALPEHQRSRADRRPADGRPGYHGRDGGLVLLSPVRLAQRLRLAAGRGQGRLLPDHAGPGRFRLPAAVLPGHRHPDHPVHDPGRGWRGDRLHAGGRGPGHQPPPAGPAGPGGARHDAVRGRHQAALRLRPPAAQAGDHRRGRPVPHRPAGADPAHGGRPRHPARRPGRRAGAGRRGLAHAPDPEGGRERRDGAGVHGRPAAAAAGRHPGDPVHRDRRLLARLAAQVHLHRPVAGDGHPLGDDAQADDLRADRGAGGRAHRRAARAGRRGTQLGLPLHLDPGRLVLGLRPARPGLCGGGGRVRHVGPRPAGRAQGQQRRLPAAHHVPGGRVVGSHRGDPGPLGGLARLAPGPHRQRRLRPAPAGHLR